MEIRQSSSIHRRVRSAGPVKLFDGAGPVRARQPRRAAVGEEATLGLAVQTVVRLVLGVADSLDGDATPGAGLTIATLDRHAAVGRDLLRHCEASLAAELLGSCGDRGHRCLQVLVDQSPLQRAVLMLQSGRECALVRLQHLQPTRIMCCETGLAAEEIQGRAAPSSRRPWISGRSACR